MELFISSTDPSNYGILKFNTNPSIGQDQFVEMQVLSFSTISLIEEVTSKDYIKLLKPGGDEYVCTVGSSYDYNLKDLAAKIDTSCIKMTYDGNKVTLTIPQNTQLEISHRLKMLMGFINYKFTKVTEETTYSGIPLKHFGHLLYLVANTPSTIMANDDKGHEVQIPIVYQIPSFILPGKPLLYQEKGPKTLVKVTDLTHLEFRLVDYTFHDVQLNAPMHLRIRLKRNQYRNTNNLQKDVNRPEKY